MKFVEDSKTAAMRSKYLTNELFKAFLIFRQWAVSYHVVLQKVVLQKNNKTSTMSGGTLETLCLIHLIMAEYQLQLFK